MIFPTHDGFHAHPMPHPRARSSILISDPMLDRISTIQTLRTVVPTSDEWGRFYPRVFFTQGNDSAWTILRVRVGTFVVPIISGHIDPTVFDLKYANQFISVDLVGEDGEPIEMYPGNAVEVDIELIPGVPCTARVGLWGWRVHARDLNGGEMR